MLLAVTVVTWDGKWKALGEDPAGYAALRAKVPFLPPEWKEHQYTQLVVDDEGVRALADLGLTVTLSGQDPGGVAGTMLVKLQDRLDKLGADVSSLADMVKERCIVQIALPDIGLMTIDDVTVLVDCCTESLQSHLTDGWRLLAVCPPNAQRRPDYVLGRRMARKQ